MCLTWLGLAPMIDFIRDDDDDDVRFVLDEHVELDFYSASLLKQQFE